jgi:hypothetical protein
MRRWYRQYFCMVNRDLDTEVQAISPSRRIQSVYLGVSKKMTKSPRRGANTGPNASVAIVHSVIGIPLST